MLQGPNSLEAQATRKSNREKLFSPERPSFRALYFVLRGNPTSVLHLYVLFVNLGLLHRFVNRGLLQSELQIARLDFLSLSSIVMRTASFTRDLQLNLFSGTILRGAGFSKASSAHAFCLLISFYLPLLNGHVVL